MKKLNKKINMKLNKMQKFILKIKQNKNHDKSIRKLIRQIGEK